MSSSSSSPISPHTNNNISSVVTTPQEPSASPNLTNTIDRTNDVAKTPDSTMKASTSKSKLPLFDRLNDFVVSLGEIAKKAVDAIKSKIQTSGTVKKSQIQHEEAKVNSSSLTVDTKGFSSLVNEWKKQYNGLQPGDTQKANDYAAKLDRFLDLYPNLPNDVRHDVIQLKGQFEKFSLENQKSQHTDSTISSSSATSIDTTASSSNVVIKEFTVKNGDQIQTIKLEILGERGDLGKGDSGVVTTVLVKVTDDNGNVTTKKMALKQPQSSLGGSEEAQKERDDALTKEAKTTGDITAGAVNGMLSNVQLGEVDGSPAMLMELFDSTLEVKTNNQPDSKTYTKMMSDILDGVSHVKEKGYAWADARPENIARIRIGDIFKYICFDFGASVKLENVAGSASQTYVSTNDKFESLMSLKDMKKLMSNPTFRQQELDKLVKICEQNKLSTIDIKRILFYNDVLKLGLDDETKEILENALADVLKGVKESNVTINNPINKPQIIDIKSKLKPKNIDEFNFLKNVNKKIFSYNEEFKVLNHKKDMLALGISFYEILFQKFSAVEANDHFAVDRAGGNPRYDVMINDLMGLHDKTDDEKLKSHIKATIAMMDPDWKKRPSVEAIQDYLSDPKSKSSLEIEARVSELSDQAKKYKAINEKKPEDRTSTEQEELQDTEKQWFGEKLQRNENGAIKMRVEENRVLFNDYRKLNEPSTEEQKQERNNLEEKLMGKVLDRDDNGEITPKDQKLLNKAQLQYGTLSSING